MGGVDTSTVLRLFFSSRYLKSSGPRLISEKMKDEGPLKCNPCREVRRLGVKGIHTLF